ncbi:prepilin peptidase [Arthrobacter sp. MYb227]|nr:prepilin peptidase [Arthrobacter sp. MYb227]
MGWLTASTILDLLAGILVSCALALFLINGVRLSIIDLRTRLLPNAIIFPWFVSSLILLGAAALCAGEPERLLRSLTGAGILFGGYLLVHFLVPGGMGLGDVKLAAVLGLYLGFVSWAHLFIATVLAFILGAGVSAMLLLSKRMNLRSSVAFGPFMLSGAAIAVTVSF